jgi:hypothetical protein
MTTVGDPSASLVERLGLGGATGVKQQHRQVIKTHGNIRMLAAISLLIDRQRLAVERLGLGGATGGPSATPPDY